MDRRREGSPAPPPSPPGERAPAAADTARALPGGARRRRWEGRVGGKLKERRRRARPVARGGDRDERPGSAIGSEPQDVVGCPLLNRGDESSGPRFSEYDPKQREYIYTRYFYRSKLDLDQESPVGPVQYTDRIFPEGFFLTNTVNVVSVKIVSSDYGYPLSAYGTIVARDSLNHKCIYMFRRGKDNCQLISSKDDALILVGPKRGVMVCDRIVFEIDLKVKDVHGIKVKDERLSKGLMEVDGILRWMISNHT